MTTFQKAYLGSTPLFKDKIWYESDSNKIIKQTSSLVVVTADNAANTKGAWTELIGSTSDNASLIYLNIAGMASSGANTASLIDIAFGASGSEIPIVENIAVGGAQPIQFCFPYKIPSGTRISARLQSVVTGGKTSNVTCSIIDSGDYDISPTSVDVIEGDVANSQGISFSGSSGTWTQAVSSTSRSYRAVAIILSMHSNNIATFTGIYSVGVGSAGNEIEFGNCRYAFFNTEASRTEIPNILPLFGRSIPAGSRLAVKHPIAANPDRYGFTLICIP
jgi:hypothetical protein